MHSSGSASSSSAISRASVEPLMQSVVGGEPVLERFDLLNRGPGRFGVCPEPGLRLLSLQRRQPLALPGKSKKVSEFSHSALQVGQTIDEVGHADSP